MRKYLIVRCFISFLAGVFSLSVHGAIDPARGAYTTQKTDFFRVVESQAYQLQRSYNVKYTEAGLFGRLWCSDLDKKLEILDENTIKLIHCSQGREEVFQQTEPNEFENKKNERLTRLQAGEYQLSLGTGAFERYDRKGRYKGVQILGQAESDIVIDRDSRGTPTKIQFGKFETFMVQANSEGLITKISGKKERISYQYNSDLLSEVKSQKQITKYKYTNEKMLSEIIEGTEKTQIQYDESGRVVLFKRPGLCHEVLNYKQFGERIITNMYVVCDKKLSRFAMYDSRYDTKRDKLISQKVADQNGLRILNLHPVFGLPTFVQQNQDQKKIEYDALARVVQIEKKNTVTKFYYSESQIAVTQKIGDYVKTTKYKYNPQGQVVRIEENPEVIWDLQYNKLGQMIFISSRLGKVDLNKKLALFKQVVAGLSRFPAAAQKSNQLSAKEIENASRIQLRITRLMEPINEVDDIYRGRYE